MIQNTWLYLFTPLHTPPPNIYKCYDRITEVWWRRTFGITEPLLADVACLLSYLYLRFIYFHLHVYNEKLQLPIRNYLRKGWYGCFICLFSYLSHFILSYYIIIVPNIFTLCLKIFTL